MDLASSLAGLLGLTGLAIQSASTLYTLCRKIPRVAGEVEAIISEVRGLSETLGSIQQVASHRTAQKASARTSGVVAKLGEEIVRCTKDLEAWTSCMTALKMEDGKSAKNMVKKLKLAADTGRFSETRLKISSHRDQLGLLIELLTVDLEMSTSLDVRAIDTKIDNFATKQASSQQMTVSHLEEIQKGVQDFGTLQHTTHETTLDISRSTDRIHETLEDIRASQATRLQVERLDTALAAIQRSLLNVASKRSPGLRTRTKRNGRRLCNTSSRVSPAEDFKDDSMLGIFSDLVQQTTEHRDTSETINNLVDLAVTVRYRCGAAQYKAIAIPDSEFEAASFETKLRMVKYLQDLRLMLWLLCRKEYICNKIFEFATYPRSTLVSEAQLVSSWTIWTSFYLASLRGTAEIRCEDEYFLKYLSELLTGEYRNIRGQVQWRHIRLIFNARSGILEWQMHAVIEANRLCVVSFEEALGKLGPQVLELARIKAGFSFMKDLLRLGGMKGDSFILEKFGCDKMGHRPVRSKRFRDLMEGFCFIQRALVDSSRAGS